MNRTPVSLAALVLAVALALALGQVADRNAFYLQPSRVDAGRPDTLEVVSLRYDCGFLYTHKSLQRTGSRIDVRFVPQARPEIVCPAVVKPYGPAFDLPALPAGRYDVYATPLAPCQVAPQPCEMPERPERVGILTVGPADESDWFLSPATAPANQAFTVRLLSGKYGSCGTVFEHTGFTRTAGLLVASFVIRTGLPIECIVDIRPHGPTFQAEPLPAGKYPVAVMEVPSCVYDPQPCTWRPGGERVVDTLVVAATVSLRPPPAAQVPGAGESAPRAVLRRQGGTLAVTFPGEPGNLGTGAGSATNGGTDLRGRRLGATGAIQAKPAAAASAAVPPASATE